MENRRKNITTVSMETSSSVFILNKSSDNDTHRKVASYGEDKCVVQHGELQKGHRKKQKEVTTPVQYPGTNQLGVRYTSRLVTSHSDPQAALTAPFNNTH